MTSPTYTITGGFTGDKYLVAITPGSGLWVYRPHQWGTSHTGGVWWSAGGGKAFRGRWLTWQSWAAQRYVNRLERRARIDWSRTKRAHRLADRRTRWTP